jgi:hypothetical protein
MTLYGGQHVARGLRVERYCLIATVYTPAYIADLDPHNNPAR